MNNKSYWIWHYGDYEIYHNMQVHLRREEQGYHRPAFWKISTPYASVKFTKTFTCDGGFLLCHINGQGHVMVDQKLYHAGKKINILSGSHTVEVHVSNPYGLPATFIESDVCPSDGSWKCNHFAGEFENVGYNVIFDDKQVTPEVFPFKYKKVLPLSKESVDGGIVFDFGIELFGFLNISNLDKGDSVGVFYGESKEEALDTDYTYVTENIAGSTSYKLRQRAFRYVYLKNAPSRVTVDADYEYLPLVQQGDFTCDNELFCKIYKTAVYTFHLNCREAFFDGIKRDRWVWAGDAYQSARINRYLFADKEIEQRTLIGLIGKEPIEQHLNTILDYSLLWIIQLYEHYLTYGDTDFLRRIYPMAKKLLDFCETRLNADGFLQGIGDDWTFIDWSEIDKDGAVCAEQMLLIHAYRVMAYLSKTLLLDNSEQFIQKSDALKSRVNEYFWNDEKGAFIDSYTSNKNNVTRHANIFAIMFDIASETQAQSILKNVLKNDAITQITTPYFEGYELDALAKMGEFEAVESKISSYWGGMINLGASTIWEEFDPTMSGIQHYAMYGGKYEKSLCHAWGAGPIYLFGRYYLGVNSTALGYETFEVRPTLGSLEEISGVVPVNGGTCTVKLNKNRLFVLSTKSGGTLVWNDVSYDLIANEPIEITF